MNPNDEIDLIQIARDGVSFVRKRGLPLLLAGLVGMGIAAGYRSWRTIHYTGEVSFLHDVLTEEYIRPLTESIQRQLNQGSYDSLSHSFGLSVEAVKSISEVKLIISPFEKTISQQERELIAVKIQATQPQLLPEIQTGLIRAFQNNAFLQRRLFEKRSEYDAALTSIGHEKKLLDSLKQLLLKNQGIKPSFDPAGVFYQSVILERQRHQYQIKRHRLDDWSPVVSLVNNVESDQPSWLSVLGKGFFGGVVSMLAFLQLRSLLNHPSSSKS